MTEPSDRARPIPLTGPRAPSGPPEPPVRRERGRRDDGGPAYVIDTRGRNRGQSPAAAGASARGSRGLPPEPAAAPERVKRRVPTGAGMDSTPPTPSPPRVVATPPPAPPRPPSRARRRRPLKWVVLTVALWLVFLVAVPLRAWSSVRTVDSTPSGARPEGGSGANYLLVGSDSRAGMSVQEQETLSTGPDEGAGQRTDSIILIHRSSSGQSSMISIPRDSYVDIPGRGKNKINAAYALGGPSLLVATVEQATGLRVDGYLEIGFGGFANVVDSLGGVNVCVPFDMNDPKAGINLTAGCQDLDGPTALGFVRARYSDPRGDIGRAERQRQFLSAIVKKAATPATIVLPWRYYGFTMASASGLAVGGDTSIVEAAQVIMTMRDISGGQGLSMVVPIANPGLSTAAGAAVKWDTTKANALFDALRSDAPLTAPLPGTDGVPTGG